MFNLKNMKKTQGLEKVNRNPSFLASERGGGEENKKKVENFRATESDYKETSVSMAMMKEMHHGCRINKNSELGRGGAGWDWNKHRLFHRVLSVFLKNEQEVLPEGSERCPLLCCIRAAGARQNLPASYDTVLTAAQGTESGSIILR